MIRAKRLPQALANLRNLPLEQLKLIFGPTLWRCTYCHRFFEAKDLRKRRYCSSPKRCGKDMEARKAVAQMRDAVDNEKLRRVRGALELQFTGTDQRYRGLNGQVLISAYRRSAILGKPSEQ
jgi:hypothetical protein